MAKINVGQNFLEAVKGHKVVCFEITASKGIKARKQKFILKKGYKKADFNEVVKRMLGCKALDSEISGTIWCKKGVWFVYVCDYGEYSEEWYWAKLICPQIPEYLSWFDCVDFMVFCGYSGCPLKINRSSLAGMIHSIENKIKHVSTYIVNSCYLKNLVINIKINIIMREK